MISHIINNKYSFYELSPTDVNTNKNTYGNEHEEATDKLTNGGNYIPGS